MSEQTTAAPIAKKFEFSRELFNHLMPKPSMTTAANADLEGKTFHFDSVMYMENREVQDVDLSEKGEGDELQKQERAKLKFIDDNHRSFTIPIRSFLSLEVVAKDQDMTAFKADRKKAEDKRTIKTKRVYDYINELAQDGDMVSLDKPFEIILVEDREVLLPGDPVQPSQVGEQDPVQAVKISKDAKTRGKGSKADHYRVFPSFYYKAFNDQVAALNKAHKDAGGTGNASLDPLFNNERGFMRSLPSTPLLAHAETAEAIKNIVIKI